jgi:hypothetical protein
MISVEVIRVHLLNIKIGHWSILIACTTLFTIVVVFVLLQNFMSDFKISISYIDYLLSIPIFIVLALVICGFLKIPHNIGSFK